MCVGLIPHRLLPPLVIKNIIGIAGPQDSVEAHMGRKTIRVNPEGRETAWAGRRLPSLSNHHAICHLADRLFHKSLSKPTDDFSRIAG
jgi:hypothetical protein